ncbi:SDR family NAD(P)-dependent oxidoreductase [Dongia soli]|uniref:3-oxoacyl-ACP reductase family protein n=1 Tax=Dongia soli TaxID=600628 RepID=A0ABU5EIS8_9PROT|nr:3-oxoacyl-ACP reductase family protein [Dongia soli]MDY0885201.1 3-oxoacyl-ACP reductase family protein [Dongia soli]
MTRLKNKVALVTGGARGIGAAIVERLCAEGAAVAFTYVTAKQPAEALVKAIGKAGGVALAIRADSGDAEAVKAAVAETVEVFGRLDILVNNAAIEIPGTIDSYPLEKFDRMIAVNIKGPFIAAQEAVRHMKEGGRIINIGSVSSDFMPVPEHAVYAMTKGAVASLTRGLARDLGPRGITVNNVQPGRVETDLLRAISSAPGGEKVREPVALKRLGKSEEVASLVAYLASAESSFVTGANMKVDGGASA